MTTPKVLILLALSLFAPMSVAQSTTANIGTLAIAENQPMSNIGSLFAHRGPHYQHHRGYQHNHYRQRNQSHNRSYHIRTKAKQDSEFYGGRSLDRDQFATFASRKATGNKVFIFDPRRLKWYAYSRSGNLVASGRASGGKGYCPDVKRSCRTPVGTYSVYHKGNAYCKSSKYPLGRGGAPMPHCMFFRGGYAIHGSPDVPGHNASHGCIRVLPSAARWLHGNFIDYGTTVIVRPY